MCVLISRCLNVRSFVVVDQASFVFVSLFPRVPVCKLVALTIAFVSSTCDVRFSSSVSRLASSYVVLLEGYAPALNVGVRACSCPVVMSAL